MQKNNSKLNTVLLIILIILVVVGIWMLYGRKGTLENDMVQSPSGYTQTNLNPNGPDYQPNNWILDEKSKYYYPAEATRMPDDEAELTFKYKNMIVEVGGAIEGPCGLEPDFEFQYGKSDVGCLQSKIFKNGIVNAYILNNEDPISQEELNIFGDFILKNQ